MKRGWTVDRIGAVASAVCAVHCVLTGVALSLLPVVGLQFLATPIAEWTFIGLAITLGGWAIYHGIRAHGDWRPSLLYVAGIASLLISHFAFDHGHAHGNHVHEASSPWTTVFAVGAGLCFVGFHLINARMQKRCGCKSCESSKALS